jgi:hypothetical protein
MSHPRPEVRPATNAVLGKAVLRAAERLGLSRTQLATALGRDRTSLTRSGVDPESKAGELAMLLVRVYRSLAVLVDDDEGQMQEWLVTPNRHTGGVPREQLLTVTGLVTVCTYLDAIRAKV